MWQVAGPGAGEREIFDDDGVVEEFFLFKDFEVMVVNLVSLVFLLPLGLNLILIGNVS